MDKNDRGPKSFLVAWLLSLLVGVFGVDRFYLGKIGTGLLKLFTFGGIGVWWFVDLIILLCDGTRDKEGRKLADYDKNKIVAIIVTVVVFVLGGVFGANQKPAAVDTHTVAPAPAASQPAPTPEPEKWDVEAAYAKIQNGMTKAQVEEATGKKPETCTTSEDPTFGKMEYCTYGNAFTDKAAISVTYSQDKVSSKTKSTY